jgi:hypothetical protein
VSYQIIEVELDGGPGGRTLHSRYATKEEAA